MTHEEIREIIEQAAGFCNTVFRYLENEDQDKEEVLDAAAKLQSDAIKMLMKMDSESN